MLAERGERLASSAPRRPPPRTRRQSFAGDPATWMDLRGMHPPDMGLHWPGAGTPEEGRRGGWRRKCGKKRRRGSTRTRRRTRHSLGQLFPRGGVASSAGRDFDGGGPSSGWLLPLLGGATPRLFTGTSFLALHNSAEPSALLCNSYANPISHFDKAITV